MYFEKYREGLGTSTLLGLSGGAGWRWRLKSGNHEIIASGESYTTEAGCDHAIGLVAGTNSSTPVIKL